MSAEGALIDPTVRPDQPIDAGLRAVALRHRRVSLTLACVLMGSYLILMLLVAYAKPLLGTLVAPGISLGLVLGAGMIVFAWLLACGYVIWANRCHDPACRRLA
jgi:uncharacterized membrane protein (DUF485 family)